MWCCASKPEVKKVLKSAKEETLTKVLLNLPPTIQLEYKNEWKSKISQREQIPQDLGYENSKVEENEEIKQSIKELKEKIENLQKMKEKLIKSYEEEENQEKELEENLAKTEAIETVLSYMILKKEKEVDSYAMKIKT